MRLANALTINRHFPLLEAGAPAEPRIAGSNVAYACGDSITEQNVDNTFSYGVRGSGLSWARGLTDERLLLTIAAIDGGSGESAATIRSTRFPTALASAAKILFLMASANLGASLAQDIADITYMAETFAESASDRIVFLFDGIPGGTNAGWDATRKTRHAALRDAIRLLDDPTIGLNVVPSWNAIAATTDGDEPTAGMTETGGVHPIIPGSMALGRMLVPFIEARVPDRDPYAGETFLAGAGLSGGNLAGVTGNAISVAGITATGAASSRVFVDGDGTKWVELTINGTGNVDFYPTAGTLPAGVTPGVTALSSIVKVKLHAGLDNCRQVSLRQIKQSAGDIAVNAGQDGRHPGSSTEIGQLTVVEDTLLTLHTPAAVVAADATSVRWSMTIAPERIGAVNQTMTGIVSISFPGMMLE